MKIDTMRLLENTIGIQGLSSHYTPSDGSGGLEDSDSEREAPDNHHHRSSWTVQL
jgi:hypothetical protein